MKKQGYNARLDESLGGRNKGSHTQSLKDRRDESKGMEKASGKRAYSADQSMKYHHTHPAHANNVGKHITSLIKK
tara:strand:+ start:24 stop:248 length:225 start_codon:yes stop_codon:yes gene_type:complete